MGPIYKNKYIPQNYLAEEILLGIIIIYPEVAINIRYILKKEYFFLEFHEIMYVYMLEAILNKRYNIIRLIHKLENKQIIGSVKVCKKITRMMRQSQVFINFSSINDYVKQLIHLLHNTYIKRVIIQYGYNVIRLGSGSLTNNAYMYSKMLFYIKFIGIEINNYRNSNQELANIKELLSSKLLKIKHPNIYNSEDIINQSRTLKSGFETLDSITNGLPDGNLIVIAGRPSVGKTSLAINIAYNTFMWQNISICFFSLEMSSQEVLNRIISVSCDLGDNNNLGLTQNKWKNIIKICEKLLVHNIYINDKYNIDINYIEYVTKSLKKNSKTNLIIIDYLQLIELKSTKKLNRSQELGYITRKLKLLAQLLRLPIIILSQLNRNIETRNDKEPLLSDLRESGCVSNENNIDMSYLNNNININNINHTSGILLTNFNSHNYFNQVNKVSERYNIVYLSEKSSFSLSSKTSQLYTTYNHKYLCKISWIQLNCSVRSVKFNSIIKNKSYKSMLLYDNYLIKVKYINNLKTYDININSKYHFLSGDIILHNSIEQDSDIILILQNKKININNCNNHIIDIKVSKNRNGKTGSCEIKFTPETTAFKIIK